MAYIRANGYIGVALYILTIVLNQAFSVLSAVWLKNWSQHNNQRDDNTKTTWYLSIYFALGFSMGLMSLLNGLALYSFCIIRSAKVMHDSMFEAVIRSPMMFFETTPSKHLVMHSGQELTCISVGTVLNRFSRDVYVIDEVLARVFGGFFRTFASVVGVIIVITSQVPLYIVVCIPIAFIYNKVQKYYLATSRELKRLDAITKSPIFASFSETLNGLSTIRAFKQSERFVAENESRLDRNQECYFPSVSCNRWLAVRLELLGAVLIFAAAVLCVWALNSGKPLDAGLVGIIISFSLTITGSLNWFVRSATEVETNMVRFPDLYADDAKCASTGLGGAVHPVCRAATRSTVAHRRDCPGKLARQGRDQVRPLLDPLPARARPGLEGYQSDLPAESKGRHRRSHRQWQVDAVHVALPHPRAGQRHDLHRRRRHLETGPARPAQ
jgi:ATP-binding cassette subfamily C (CFTR/MRP) protein 1